MLKAGFSRVDVTPPLGIDLWGYFYRRPSAGVHDPIELCAVAFSDGDKTALFIVADFVGIQMKYVNKLRKLISEKTGIETKYIQIHATHTHASIGLCDPGLMPFDNNVLEDSYYLDVLYRKFVDVSVMAIEDMSEAKPSYGEKETPEPLAFIRRYIMKDGKVQTNPHNRESEIVRPSEEPDNFVRLLKLEREGKRDIALINFSTHPDVIGGDRFSAEWPGFARRNVEKLMKNVYCITTIGFMGDSNHVNFMGEKKRLLPRSLEMGKILAETTVDLWDKTAPVEGEELFVNEGMVYTRTSTDKEEFYDECAALLSDVDEEGKLKSNKTDSGISSVEAKRIFNIKESESIYRKIPVSVLAIENFAILGTGCQPFVNYAKLLREAYPDKIIMSAAEVNGHEGYLPTKVAYGYGGYEVISSPFTPVIEEEFMKEFKKVY